MSKATAGDVFSVRRDGHLVDIVCVIGNGEQWGVGIDGPQLD